MYSGGVPGEVSRQWRVAPAPPRRVQEYLLKWNAVHQYFLKDPIVPQDGKIQVSLLDKPGMGLELDETKIEQEKDLNFREL